MKRNKGLGRVYQPTFRDRHTGELKHSPTWWIAVGHRGKRYQFSSGSDKRADAVKVLKAKLAELGAGRPIGARRRPHHVRGLGRDGGQQLSGQRPPLRPPALGQARQPAPVLRHGPGARHHGRPRDRLRRFAPWQWRRQRHRQPRTGVPEAQLSPGSPRGPCHQRALIGLLHEDNRRKGFFEEEQFRAVLDHLPDDLKPVCLTAYVTGWRIDSEILTRKRSHLDLNAGWLRLEPGETKNGEGRMFPLTPELKATLEAQLSRTRELEKAGGRIIPWLFHRDSEPIKSFRRSWLSACKAAGVPGRLRHDFRRTAVRNLERAGVSRSDAMAMVGHRTVSIYYRYAIADEKSLKAAAEKLAALHGQMSDERTDGVSTFAKHC